MSGKGRRLSSAVGTHTASSHTSNMLKKDGTALKMEEMAARREERRMKRQELKQKKEEEIQRNLAAGNPGDVDFIGLVEAWRRDHAGEAQELDGGDDGGRQDGSSRRHHPRICICVRKRPISDKERQKNDHDSVTVLNPAVWIHSAKLKVDGITKYLDHAPFRFDYAFGEKSTTQQIYERTTMPLLDHVCRGTGGRATIFAYGQTGSGKTFTMQGLQGILAEDLFMLLEQGNDAGGGDEGGGGDGGCCSLDNTKVMVSFFELYAGHVLDLLNEGNRLKMLEDGRGEINLLGLSEVEASTPAQLLEVLAEGNDARTTHATEANDMSSRSHAICHILLRDRARKSSSSSPSSLRGKLSLCDLAGSERGSDTKQHSAQRRAECCEINTSLLALKECIRALDKKSAHVNYRQSKLTLILKDCFASESAMTTMIATVSPGASAADHSLNTLRYADRVKENKRLRGGGAAPGSRSPSRPKISPRGDGAAKTATNAAAASRLSEAPTASAATAVPPPPPTPTPQPAASAKADSNGQVVGKRTTHSASGKVNSKAGKENEEDEILNLHMQNIQVSAELLDREGVMLKNLGWEGADVGDVTASESTIKDYVAELETILDRKQEMLDAFREKMRKVSAIAANEGRKSAQE